MNQILEPKTDTHYISYNPGSYFNGETALVITYPHKTIYLILEGRWLNEYRRILEDLQACIDFFASHKEHWSDMSDPF